MTSGAAERVTRHLPAQPHRSREDEVVLLGSGLTVGSGHGTPWPGRYGPGLVAYSPRLWWRTGKVVGLIADGRLGSLLAAWVRDPRGAPG